MYTWSTIENSDHDVTHFTTVRCIVLCDMSILMKVFEKERSSAYAKHIHSSQTIYEVTDTLWYVWREWASLVSLIDL